jgi:hypothetical protein
MSRSRGKSLDSSYNLVYRPSCTLDTIPPRSSFSAVSRIHQIRSTVFQQLGRDRIRVGCLVVFQVFQRPFYFLTARQINAISIISHIDWTCWLLRFGPFVQVFFKMFFQSRQFLLVNSSPIHITSQDTYYI